MRGLVTPVPPVWYRRVRVRISEEECGSSYAQLFVFVDAAGRFRVPLDVIPRVDRRWSIGASVAPDGDFTDADPNVLHVRGRRVSCTYHGTPL